MEMEGDCLDTGISSSRSYQSPLQLYTISIKGKIEGIGGIVRCFQTCNPYTPGNVAIGCHSVVLYHANYAHW
jgi:acetyltransferase-like isoleucine patch superfamily enzyme